VHPLRTPKGQLRRGVREQIETSNWSGYAVARFQTGTDYTSASGAWTVPSVSNAPGFSNSYSSSWVGVGGFCLNSSCSSVDNTLIQLGTEQDASGSGATQYYAWYELLPKSPVQIPLAVSPGDRIVASLVDGAAGVRSASLRARGFRRASGPKGGGGRAGGPKRQTWTLTMTDQTTGSSWSTTVSYDSSLASAEWVQEAPYSGSVLPLADYGTATFDPGSADGASPALVPADGLVMIDPPRPDVQPVGTRQRRRRL